MNDIKFAAIGGETGRVYEEAESKRELLRKLQTNYSTITVGNRSYIFKEKICIVFLNAGGYLI